MSEDVRQKGIVVEANGKRATVRFKKNGCLWPLQRMLPLWL